MPAPETPEPEPGLGPITEPKAPLPGPDVLPDPLPRPASGEPPAPQPGQPIPLLAANPSTPEPTKQPDQPAPVPRPEDVPPRPGGIPEGPANPIPGPPQAPPPETPAPPTWARSKPAAHIAAPVRSRWRPDPGPFFFSLRANRGPGWGWARGA